VRSPARSESDLIVAGGAFALPPGGTPAIVRVSGDKDWESEVLVAYEAGYRVRPTERLALDVAVFYHDYSKLRTIETAGTPFMETTPAPPHMVFPSVMDNKMRGEAYGVEVAGDYSVTDRWKLRIGYSYLNQRLHLASSSTDTMTEAEERFAPRHQFHIRSYLDLPRNLQLDTALYYVDSLPALDVDSYVRLDTRLAWRPRDGLEVALVLQNLLDGRHREFGDSNGTVAREIERAVYAVVRWEF